MAIRLKYNEKPEEPNMTEKLVIDYRNPKSDVTWMTSEEWYKKGEEVKLGSTDVPKEIMDLIPAWREDSKLCTSWAGYYIKYAGLDCYYKGRKYYFDSDILSGIKYEMMLPSGKTFSIPIDYVFESIYRQMEQDLYSIGADYVHYHGMID